MSTDPLKRVSEDSGPPATPEEPLYGRLLPPNIPGWSYPADEHVHPLEKPANAPHASARPVHEHAGHEAAEHPVAVQDRRRLARLSGLLPDVLRPARPGHDYVGGMIAGLAVVTVGIALLLFALMAKSCQP